MIIFVTHSLVKGVEIDGREHSSCGGRSLNDDVMDALYTLYITGGYGPRISDGVDQATGPASLVFPNLAPAIPQEDLVRPGSGELAACRRCSVPRNSTSAER